MRCGISGVVGNWEVAQHGDKNLAEVFNMQVQVMMLESFLKLYNKGGGTHLTLLEGYFIVMHCLNRSRNELAILKGHRESCPPWVFWYQSCF